MQNRSKKITLGQLHPYQKKQIAGLIDKKVVEVFVDLLRLKSVELETKGKGNCILGNRRREAKKGLRKI